MPNQTQLENIVNRNHNLVRKLKYYKEVNSVLESKITTERGQNVRTIHAYENREQRLLTTINYLMKELEKDE